MIEELTKELSMTHLFNLNMYTKFLIANGNRYSGVEAAKALTETNDAPAHDTISRWLSTESFSPNDLWQHVATHVGKEDDLIIDDSTLDKSFSRKNELVHFHWSGNAHKTIRGISLVNLLSTNGTTRIPVDYRIYQGSESAITKNDHMQAMLDTAKERGLEPRYVMTDSWYSSLDNMKYIVKLGWSFIMGLKENRLVNEVQGTYLAVGTLDWTKKNVRKVWLKGFGFVLVAQIVFKNGDIRYVATNDLTLTVYEDLSDLAKKRWSIEEFHRGIKQTTGIEKCYSIKKTSQQNHIFASFVAFVGMEFERLKSGVSWYAQKVQKVRLGITAAFA